MSTRKPYSKPRIAAHEEGLSAGEVGAFCVILRYPDKIIRYLMWTITLLNPIVDDLIAPGGEACKNK